MQNKEMYNEKVSNPERGSSSSLPPKVNRYTYLRETIAKLRCSLTFRPRAILHGSEFPSCRAREVEKPSDGSAAPGERISILKYICMAYKIYALRQ